MSENPKRRLLDAVSSSPTFIGEGTRFDGNFSGIGPFVLCGHVKGDGRIDGPLNLAVSGHWEGEVQATQAVIAGKVTGDLRIDEKLEIARQLARMGVQRKPGVPMPEEPSESRTI